MLEAYFDESERTGGTFAVAGYAFVPQQARKFDKEWLKLFAGTGGCHMVDLAAGRKAFEDVSRKERNRLLKEAVKIINRRITFGVAISVNVNEIRQLSPQWIQGFGDSYPVCCHFVMAGIGNAIVKAGLPDDVAYVFEAGANHEGEARRFIAHVAHGGPLKDYYRHRSDAFLTKTDAVALQSADMLAWEWAKCQEETREKQIRPIRKSLRTLFESEGSRYTVHHFTGFLLRRYLNSVRQLGLSQLSEDGERVSESR